MTHLDDASVTRLIAELKNDDPEAARRLWNRYFQRVVALARQRLGRASRRAADEEDVAINVFQSLCAGAADGRFEQLNDRDDLWRLLLTITRHKAADQVRREVRKKRGGGHVRGESVFLKPDGSLGGKGIHDMLASEPTVEFLASVEEEHQRLLALLPHDSLRAVARRRLEGYTNEEVAAQMDVSVRTVERKLRLVRQYWAKQLEP